MPNNNQAYKSSNQFKHREMSLEIDKLEVVKLIKIYNIPNSFYSLLNKVLFYIKLKNKLELIAMVSIKKNQPFLKERLIFYQ